MLPRGSAAQQGPAGLGTCASPGRPSTGSSASPDGIPGTTVHAAPHESSEPSLPGFSPMALPASVGCGHCCHLGRWPRGAWRSQPGLPGPQATTLRNPSRDRKCHPSNVVPTGSLTTPDHGLTQAEAGPWEGSWGQEEGTRGGPGVCSAGQEAACLGVPGRAWCKHPSTPCCGGQEQAQVSVLSGPPGPPTPSSPVWKAYRHLRPSPHLASWPPPHSCTGSSRLAGSERFLNPSLAPRAASPGTATARAAKPGSPRRGPRGRQAGTVPPPENRPRQEPSSWGCEMEQV